MSLLFSPNAVCIHLGFSIETRFKQVSWHQPASLKKSILLPGRTFFTSLFNINITPIFSMFSSQPEPCLDYRTFWYQNCINSLEISSTSVITATRVTLRCPNPAYGNLSCMRGHCQTALVYSKRIYGLMKPRFRLSAPPCPRFTH